MVTFLGKFEKSADSKIAKDAFESIKEEMQSNRVGYYKLPKNSFATLEEAKTIETSGFTQIVVIGIGGSSLGLKAIDAMLRPIRPDVKETLFFENSDPLTLVTLMQKVRPKEAAFFVISKSGTTIETISIFKTLIYHFNLKLGTKDKERIFAITDENSDLDRFAVHYGVKRFHIPHNVGGRFSVLSAVGVVVLHCIGYDVAPILKGASTFTESFFAKKEQHLLDKATFYYENSKKLSINVLFSYADSLENFNKWYVQLWGESLGKIDAHQKHVGLTPVGIIGAVDQHSFLQLIIEGVLDKTVTFVNVSNLQANLRISDVKLEHMQKCDFLNNKTFMELLNAQCKAVMQSVEERGIKSDLIVLDVVDEENIGVLIIYFELLTSLVGAMFGIDTYNQNGVELGKKILYSNLVEQN